jgi:hypothetical protein
MICPYLRGSGSKSRCEAYIGDFNVPSRYEEEYFCCSLSHTACVWYASRDRMAAAERAELSSADEWAETLDVAVSAEGLLN